MAIGFCKRIQELGYKVPEDISIVGIDNIAACKNNQPSLSTLEIDTKKIGATCFHELMDIINDEKKKHVIHVQTKIIERDSVRFIN